MTTLAVTNPQNVRKQSNFLQPTFTSIKKQKVQQQSQVSPLKKPLKQTSPVKSALQTLPTDKSTKNLRVPAAYRSKKYLRN
jgi:hypothetical protein